MFSGHREARCGIGTKKKRKKGHFTTRGLLTGFTDSHDKLMGYQYYTFPLAIYGCLDTGSRKLLWLRVWISNCDLKVVGRWYLDYRYETRVIPAMLRVDKNTENELGSWLQCTPSYEDVMVTWTRVTLLFMGITIITIWIRVTPCYSLSTLYTTE